MSNPRFSASRFSAFKGCRQKYKLTYKDELVVIGKAADVTEKGLAFHSIAEEMSTNMTEEDLLQVASNIINEREFDKEKYPVIKSVPRLVYWWNYFVKPLEESGYEVRKEVWYNDVLAGAPVTGAVDCLIINEKEKKAEIIDYKTANTPNASSYKNQLMFYAYLVGKQMGLTMEETAENIGTSIFFPLAGLDKDVDETTMKDNTLKNMKRVLFTVDQMKEVVESFENIIKEDQQIDWDSITPSEGCQISYICNFCSFAGHPDYCPVTYKNGIYFPRSSKVVTKEESKKLNNKV
jgi:hypothetical protein